MNRKTLPETTEDVLHVSLKQLAADLAADRSTVRRWLREAGVRAVVMGNGRNAAVRYRASEIRQWLAAQETVS